ncbi:Protein F38B6.6 [Aphelenchoides avenae]|nr:Protein F38B6.6 [Aphelenchus avenae]
MEFAFFRVEHWLFGLNPLPFHATNIVLHAVASVLCHRFLRTIGGTLASSTTSCQQCYLAAVLFAVHPIHTEAVCNLVGRAELLMSIFALGAFLCYAKLDECKGSGLRLQASFFAFVVLALLSKEQGIMILPICATFEMLAAWQGKVAKKKCAVRVAQLMTMFIVLSFLRHWINGFESPSFSAADNPAAFHPSRVTRAINYVYVWLLNMWLLVNPSQLCFDYSMGCIPLIERPLLDYRFGICLAVIPAIACGLVSYYRAIKSQKT